MEGEAVSAAALVFPPVLKCFFDDGDDDDCPVASFGVAGVVLFDPASDCGKSNGALGVTGVPTRAVCFLVSWPCLTGLTCRGVTSSSSGLLQAVRTKPQEVGMRLRDKEGGGEAMADTLHHQGKVRLCGASCWRDFEIRRGEEGGKATGTVPKERGVEDTEREREVAKI